LITNEIVRYFFDCQYKAFLRFSQKFGDKTEFELLESELLTRLRLEYFKNLQAKTSEQQIIDQASLINGYIVTDTVYVLQPLFNMKKFQISFDAINVIPDTDNHDSCKCLYVPIEIIAKEVISKAEKLIFIIKCLILSENMELTLDFGQIVYGRNLKSLKINLSDHVRAAKPILQKIINTINTKTPPSFI
jgi:hypothetical protein